jgi:peptidoglycan/LPS O-acetylase OafA/YrhL
MLHAHMTHEEYQDRIRIPALDVLRAFSVMIVVTVHTHIGHWGWLAGAKGVTFFFILSGYLITYLALREERENGVLNLTAFYVRRTFRIFPVYYLTVAIYVLLLLVLRTKPDKIDNFLAALPYLLTYLQEVPFLFGVNGAHENIPLYQAWSLGIEEKFYLIWPLLIFVVLKGHKPLRLPACIAVATACAIAPQFWQYGSLLFPYFHILIGCALALLLDKKLAFNLLGRMGTPGCILPVLLTFLVVHFSWPYFAIFPFDKGIDIFYSLVAGAFLAVVLLSGLQSGRILTCPLLLLIGRLSYTIYLLHVLCLNVVETLLARLPSFIPLSLLGPLNLFCTLLLAIAASWIVHSVVEKPLINVGHRVSRHVLARSNTRLSASVSPARVSTG